MAGLWRQVRRYGRDFVTNWSTYEAGLGTKARLLVRNRSRTLFNRGCCGNHGEPGC
jgi:hypothetical protein